MASSTLEQLQQDSHVSLVVSPSPGTPSTVVARGMSTDLPTAPELDDSAAGGLRDKLSQHYSHHVEKPSRFTKRWWVKQFNTKEYLVVLVLLLVTDALLAILQEADDALDTDPTIDAIVILIVSIFLVEVGVRIWGLGKPFFKNWLNVADALIVLASFVLSVAARIDGVGSILLVGRVLRMGRLFRVVLRFSARAKDIKSAARQTVSMNKRRFRRGSVDLDLTYITDQIIAMSVPAEGKEQLYRNPIDEVARFFDTRHWDRYYIFAACPERMYDTSKFHERVQGVDVRDHSVLPLYKILDVCEDMEEWLSQHEENVVAVHCRGGKGRTGLLVCSLLLYLYSQHNVNAAEVLAWFAARRTDESVEGGKLQGVDTPSQARYIKYMEHVMQSGEDDFLSQSKPVAFSRVVLNHLPEEAPDATLESSATWTVVVNEHPHRPPDGLPPRQYTVGSGKVTTSETRSLAIDLPQELKLHGDLQFSVLKHTPTAGIETVCSFWLHTAMLEGKQRVLPKARLDGVHKDTANAVVPEHFEVQLNYHKVAA